MKIAPRPRPSGPQPWDIHFCPGPYNSSFCIVASKCSHVSRLRIYDAFATCCLPMTTKYLYVFRHRRWIIVAAITKTLWYHAVGEQRYLHTMAPETFLVFLNLDTWPNQLGNSSNVSASNILNKRHLKHKHKHQQLCPTRIKFVICFT